MRPIIYGKSRINITELDELSVFAVFQFDAKLFLNISLGDLNNILKYQDKACRAFQLCYFDERILSLT